MGDVRITADDVESVVRLAVGAHRDARAAAWAAGAGSLEWSCGETVEHLADDLFAYAAQLGPARPSLETEVPFLWSAKRSGAPANVVFADRDAGPAGLLQVLEACGALLAAMVRTTPATVRSYHVFGVSDPEGFAAMGIVETLVHVHDIAEGLGVGWVPDEDLCDRVLRRLFPHAPTDTGRWAPQIRGNGPAVMPGQPPLHRGRVDRAPGDTGR